MLSASDKEHGPSFSTAALFTGNKGILCEIIYYTHILYSTGFNRGGILYNYQGYVLYKLGQI